MTKNQDNLRIGTRGSPLALAQAHLVQDLWQRAHGEDRTSEIVVIKTTGDAVLDRPLAEIGGKGLFTRELDTALMDGRIDVAVHSMKDVPTFLPEGITLAAILEREDARDCWISRNGKSLADFPSNTVIGTCSLRRKAQIAHKRPDVRIVDLRGNIQTRLQKLEDGEFDATLLAMAGLNRMGIKSPSMVPLEPSEMVPAAGQAAIGIAALERDEALRVMLGAMDDHATRVAVECERALLAALDGSCRTPIGAHATVNGERITLNAVLASPDGRIVHRDRGRGQVGDHKNMGAEVGYAIKRIAGPNFLEHW
jgi:hydroxymethylbilane synthase